MKFKLKLKELTIVFMMIINVKVIASEDDLYDFLWLDPDKKVYVLQNKVYKKQGTVYGNLGFLSTMTGDFQSTSGWHVSAGYYLMEEWALELKFNTYSSSNNDSYESLQRINGSVPFIRRASQSYGLSAVYSPFYGKINTFNKIIYFDWSFGLGIGKIETESNAETVGNTTQNDLFQKEDNMAILFKTALRVYVTKHVHIGLEYHRDNYQAPGPTVSGVKGEDKWRNNSDLLISIGFGF